MVPSLPPAIQALLTLTTSQLLAFVPSALRSQLSQLFRESSLLILGAILIFTPNLVASVGLVVCSLFQPLRRAIVAVDAFDAMHAHSAHSSDGPKTGRAQAAKRTAKCDETNGGKAWGWLWLVGGGAEGGAVVSAHQVNYEAGTLAAELRCVLRP